MDFAVSAGLYSYTDQDAEMRKATTLERTTRWRQSNGAQPPAGSTLEAIPTLRELDHRHTAGIDVSLLWDARTEQVSIELTDERSGESLAFAVDPSEALSAFHHPYVYATHPSFGRRHRDNAETQCRR
jgi:hypothetical protein